MLRDRPAFKVFKDDPLPIRTLIDIAATVKEHSEIVANLLAMSDVRVEMWGKKMSKKRVTSAPDLKCLPPITEAFAQNVYRAHLQASIWRSVLSPHPPDIDVTQYGWSKDETSKTLVPVTTPSDVALAPPYVLEMITDQVWLCIR